MGEIRECHRSSEAAFPRLAVTLPTDPSRRRVILVDTNVVSYRYRDDARFEPFKGSLVGRVPAISFITYAESLKGAHEAEWPDGKVAKYEAHLRRYYMLVPADRDTSATWAKLVAESNAAGIELGCDNDWWIAATALRHEIPLLTNDQGFRRLPSLTVLPAIDGPFV
jgi:predicted nucleic acid-binding protein